MKLHRQSKKAVANKQFLLRHPREHLEEKLNGVLYQLFGIVEAQKLNRQQKEINNGGDIDYTFRCFELANSMNQEANELAAAIGKHLKIAIQDEPKLSENVKITILNGYINFKLSDEFLAEAAYYVAHWLQKPSSRGTKKKTANLLVLGPTLGFMHKEHRAIKVYKYISDIYMVHGCAIKTQFLISDSSERAAFGITKLLIKAKHKHQGKSVFYKSRLQQSIRLFMAGVTAEHSEEFFIKKETDSWLKQLQKTLNKAQVKTKSISESDITDRTQNWISAQKSKNPIVHDKNSLSAFCHFTGNPPVPLRTSRGALLTGAYLLYLEDKSLQKLRKTNPNEPLVIIAPQKFHQLLYGYADRVIKDSAYKNVICFDATQLDQVIVDEHRANQPLALFFSRIAHYMGIAISNKDQKKSTKRQNLLSLIDFPIEFNELINQNQLLQLSSLINDTNKTILK